MSARPGSGRPPSYSHRWPRIVSALLRRRPELRTLDTLGIRLLVALVESV